MPLNYTVDLNNRADDLFHVTLSVDDLEAENGIYQFASTAPGTYQVMDIGRFVRSFQAFDAAGTEIPTSMIGTNQWEIARPEDVTSIRYSIAETWDTPVQENAIYLMAGSSIEDDHVLINGQTVFGFPSGMQDRPLEIDLDYPATWKVGTALTTDADGSFLAEDYDFVVDSPILLGRLTTATLDVNGTDVDIYTYSKTDKVSSDMVLESIRDILFAAEKFLGTLPVDRYAFLFHFEDVTMGAWEHSYSSEYVYAESDFEWAISESIPSVVAHEFFHIVTPLNIHSEIIQQFNFAEPVASEHLWLYEGVTEWASDIMQLRGGLITLDEYLGEVSDKLRQDQFYDSEYSLSEMSLTSYSPEGQRQFPNIYMRGALVATLLDLRLLELSGGERGLREVLIDLSQKYGPDTPFPESKFFDEFTAATHPEIADFFDLYVKDSQPLPIADYFAKIGIGYQREKDSGRQVASAGVGLNFVSGQIVVTHLADEVAECGMQIGDQLLALNGEEITIETVRATLGRFQSVAAGVPYSAKLGRDGEEIEITCEKFMQSVVDQHVFGVDSEADQAAARLRDIWMQNLPLAAG
ncbi:MAG: peptidase [Rhodothermia bacterium]|nr:peptidase [Rhodothermia bacterium]